MDFYVKVRVRQVCQWNTVTESIIQSLNQKHMKKNRYLSLVLLCGLFAVLSSNHLYGQQGGEEDPPPVYPEIVIPPSPSAWAFQNHMSNPISYYNGQYPFSIPVYEIKTDFITLPISLSYQSNGIRVDDIASDCGMGWNLNAGGAISRVVKGKPDEVASGAWNVLNNAGIDATYNNLDDLHADIKNTEYSIFEPGFQSWFWMMKNEPNYDFEYDLYSYNFAGYSGSFYLALDRKVYKLEEDGLEFQVLIDELNGVSIIKGFYVYDQKGNVFYFGDEEKTPVNSPFIETIENFSFSGAVSPDNNSYLEYPLTWHINEIRDKFNNPFIIFDYINTTETRKTFSKNIYCTYGSSSLICNDTPPTTQTKQIIKHNVKKIRQIEWRNSLEQMHGNIKFTYDTLRDDMENFDGVRLHKIEIKRDTTPIKKLIFNSDYVVSNKSYYYGFLSNDNSDYYKKRLFLNSVDFYGENGKNHTYSFFYNAPQDLPPRLSFSQDFWGYFNNVDQNAFIPLPGEYNNTNSYWADRTVANIDIVSKGMLNKIVFPTKGGVNIYYEQNRAKVNNSEVIVGGLRVSQLDYFDKQNIVKRIHLSYKNPDNKTSGLLTFSDLPIFESPRFRDISEGDLECILEEGISINSSAHNIGYTKGNLVGYERVSKYEVNITDSLTTVIDFIGPREITNFQFNADDFFSWNAKVYSKEKSWISGNQSKKSLFNSLNLEVNKEISYYENYHTDLYIPLFKFDIYGGCRNINSSDLPGQFFFSAFSVIFHPLRNKYRHIKQETREFYYSNGIAIDSLINISKFDFGDSNPIYPEKVTKFIKDENHYPKKVDYYEYMDPGSFSHIPNNLTVYPKLITRYRTGTISSTDQKFYLQQGYNVQYDNPDVPYKPSGITREIKTTGMANVSDPVSTVHDHKSYQYCPTTKKLIQETTEAHGSGDLDSHTTYIWGYNHQYIIAKTDNVAGISTELENKILELEGFSNDLTPTDQQQIRTINNAIRNMAPANAMILTYTYKPLVGVTSITDPRGRSIFYEYDSFGRLLRSRDHEGNILEEYEYHFAE